MNKRGDKYRDKNRRNKHRNKRNEKKKKVNKKKQTEKKEKNVKLKMMMKENVPGGPGPTNCRCLEGGFVFGEVNSTESGRTRRKDRQRRCGACTVEKGVRRDECFDSPQTEESPAPPPSNRQTQRMRATDIYTRHKARFACMYTCAYITDYRKRVEEARTPLS